MTIRLNPRGLLLRRMGSGYRYHSYGTVRATQAMSCCCRFAVSTIELMCETVIVKGQELQYEHELDCTRHNSRQRMNS